MDSRDGEFKRGAETSVQLVASNGLASSETPSLTIGVAPVLRTCEASLLSDFGILPPSTEFDIASSFTSAGILSLPAADVDSLLTTADVASSLTTADVESSLTAADVVESSLTAADGASSFAGAGDTPC